MKSYRPKVVRKTQADGSVKVYLYERHRPRLGHHAAGSLGALIESYRRSPEWTAKAPNTKRSYGHYFEILEKFGSMPVKDLRRRMVLELRDSVAVRGFTDDGKRAGGPAAATRFVRTVSALLTWAVKREWLDHNPLVRIESLDGGHLRAWTAEEYARLVPLLPEHLRRVAVLARFTAQRRGDLVALRWSQYDGHTVSLVQQKTGAELVIPVVAELRDELEAWRSGTVTPHPNTCILLTETGRPWDADYLSWRMRQALLAIDPAADGLNVHGFRKLAAATMAEAGATPHDIMSITGHSTLAMVELYTKSVRQQTLARSAAPMLETAGRKSR